jgi:hypothetical protein
MERKASKKKISFLTAFWLRRAHGWVLRRVCLRAHGAQRRKTFFVLQVLLCGRAAREALSPLTKHRKPPRGLLFFGQGGHASLSSAGAGRAQKTAGCQLLGMRLKALFWTVGDPEVGLTEPCSVFAPRFWAWLDQCQQWIRSPQALSNIPTQEQSAASNQAQNQRHSAPLTEYHRASSLPSFCVC